MNRILLGLGLWIIPLSLFSQKNDTIKTLPGRFTLGVRSTTSLFSHDNGAPGFGGGGQFRILVHERINTEWFSDVIFTDIGGMAKRQDYHIGWSVMFYLMKPKNFQRKFLPYVVAGNCFDYTRVTVDSRPGTDYGKFSSAVQMGAGLHYNITPKWDISFTTQYMWHLGGELHADVEDGDVHVEEHNAISFEGHLLLNLSINYKIAQLWKRKK
jgi:hypothetical protein